MIFKGWIFILAVFAIFLFTDCKKTIVSQVDNPSTSGIKFYGDQYGDILRSFDATADGGYVFGGYTGTSQTQGEQGFIQKCNKNGFIEWHKTYGGPGQEVFNVVRPTSDGGYIAAGSTTTTGGNDIYQAMYLTKIGASGTQTWHKTYSDIYGHYAGNVYFYDVRETPDHFLIATGSQNSPAETPLTVVKTDQIGDSVWEKQFITTNFNQIGTSVAIGPNGEIAIAGVAEPYDTDYYFYPTFTYLSPDGVLLMPQKMYKNFGSMPWADNGNSANGISWDFGSVNFERIISEPDGFIFVISTDPQVYANYAPCHTCGVSLSVTIFKIGFSGNILWHQKFPGKGNGIVFNDAVNNSDGSLLISGGTVDPSGINYIWLLNIDQNGNNPKESFTPVSGYSSWASGAIKNGNSYTIGVNLTLALFNQQGATASGTNHAGFFGLLNTDLNGNIIESAK